MTYTPPSGWIEPAMPARDAGSVGPAAAFHMREDCTRIRDVAKLRITDKPYSAARCPVCAG